MNNKSPEDMGSIISSIQFRRVSPIEDNIRRHFSITKESGITSYSLLVPLYFDYVGRRAMIREEKLCTGNNFATSSIKSNLLVPLDIYLAIMAITLIRFVSK